MDTVIKKRIIKGIYEYINENFDESSIEVCDEVCDFITIKLEEISTQLCFDADEHENVVNYCTNNADKYYFEEFIPSLKELCAGNDNRICIVEREGSFYLTLNEFARNSDKRLLNRYFDILQRICKSELTDSEKGDIYEKFCQKWFSLFCETVEITPHANDKGVDLIGTVRVETKMKEVINSLDYKVVIQTKLFSGKVDTPVIRRLLGDVLFLTFGESPISVFQPTILLVIGHQGFTREAEFFAKNNKVFLLSSKDLIRIASNQGNMESFECFKYLEEIDLKCKTVT